jgi:N-acetylglucosamine-6-sulfatase
MVQFPLGLLLLLPFCYAEDAGKPNIFMLLTDDQDVTLGGLKPMKKIHSLLVEKGTTFVNAFVHTPICCPSRSSFLSGRYLHNSLTFQNKVTDGCANISWAEGPEQDTYAVHAQKAGYHTHYSGKYLNQYGIPGSFNCSKRTDPGCNRVPPGWDDWHGLVGNSRYYNASIINNGERVNHGDDTSTDYAPDLFFGHTKAFLAEHLAKEAKQGIPFMMVLATPSCHGPFTPADKYIDHFVKLNVTAPRTPNYNHSNEDKQWLMREQDPITEEIALSIDHVHDRRWETLLSVDDYMGEIVGMLDAASQLDNTFILYTSDHGFQLGQHRLTDDKRHLYEHDIRIPFVMRGPGIPANHSIANSVLNVDIAPTFIDIMTGDVPDSMDGRSFAGLFGADAESAAVEWRTDFMVDYHGQGGKCGVQQCPAPKHPNFHVIDSKNNTYACVRTLVLGSSASSSMDDSMYCEFADDEHFIEYYEHDTDPWQLTNKAKTASSDVMAKLKTRLAAFRTCKGLGCRSL